MKRRVLFLSGLASLLTLLLFASASYGTIKSFAYHLGFHIEQTGETTGALTVAVSYDYDKLKR